MTAGLPARRKLFEREQGVTHPPYGLTFLSARLRELLRAGSYFRDEPHEFDFVFSQARGRARQLNLAHPVALGVVAALALGILGTAFALGMTLGPAQRRAP